MVEREEIEVESAEVDEIPELEAMDDSTEEVDYTGEIESLMGEFPDVNLGEREARYAELRALGLTQKEAFFASASRAPRMDTRSHLSGGMPKMARSPMGAMPRRELEAAREIFSGLSDRQIEDLYKKVTK